MTNISLHPHIYIYIYIYIYILPLYMEIVFFLSLLISHVIFFFFFFFFFLVSLIHKCIDLFIPSSTLSLSLSLSLSLWFLWVIKYPLRPVGGANCIPLQRENTLKKGYSDYVTNLDLVFWGGWCTLLLPLLTGPLKTGVIVPVWVQIGHWHHG